MAENTMSQILTEKILAAKFFFFFAREGQS